MADTDAAARLSNILEAVAFGLYALQSSLWEDPRTGWRQMPEGEQAKFRARARFVLSYADETALKAGRS